MQKTVRRYKYILLTNNYEVMVVLIYTMFLNKKGNYYGEMF